MSVNLPRRLKGYILSQFTKITEDNIWFPRCHETPKAQAKCKLSTNTVLSHPIHTWWIFIL